MNRRDFLKLFVAAGLLGGCDVGRPRPTLGLALGGGGARGLAHIPMLQVLDELGVRPHRIAGTSIGAVIGTLYAAGMSGQAIRDLIGRLTVSRDEAWLSALFEQDIGRWWNFIEMQFGRGGLIDAGPFAAFILETAGTSRFGDLQIPLKVVAADLWERQPVVFERGELRPALQATIAIPGLFSPVHHDGRVLVDGGLVNPVPYDLLFDDCDVVVAIDVSGRRSPVSTHGPGYFETVFNAMQLMQASIVREKLNCRPPDIYIRPGLDNVRVLEFNRVDEIYDQAGSEAEKLRRSLGG